MNSWRGTVAFVGKETLDGRMVDALYFTLASGQRPLMDAETGEVVGTVDAVGISDVQAVVGTGSTTLGPGTYTVGMDMDNVAVGPSEEGDPMHMDGRFIALHVNRQPAWQDCFIVVEEP